VISGGLAYAKRVGKEFLKDFQSSNIDLRYNNSIRSIRAPVDAEKYHGVPLLALFPVNFRIKLQNSIIQVRRKSLWLSRLRAKSFYAASSPKHQFYNDTRSRFAGVISNFTAVSS